MSWFSKRKEEKAAKAKQEGLTNLAATSLGVENKDTNKKVSKKESNKAYQQGLSADGYKTRLNDGLIEVNNELYHANAPEDLVDMNHELIDLLGRLRLNPNMTTSPTIVTFLEQQVQEIIRLAHAGDMNLIRDAFYRLQELLEALEDQATSDTLFSDETYVKLYIAKCTNQATLALYQRDVNRLNRRKEDLKKQMGTMSDIEFSRRAKELKGQFDIAQNKIANISKDLEGITFSMMTKKDQLIRDAEMRTNTAAMVNETVMTQEAFDASGIDKQMDADTEKLLHNNRNATVSDMKSSTASSSDSQSLSDEDKLSMLNW